MICSPMRGRISPPCQTGTTLNEKLCSLACRSRVPAAAGAGGGEGYRERRIIMAETQIETISINGQAQPYQPQTLSELLAVSGVDVAQPGIAVALNARVIRRAEWAT